MSLFNNLFPLRYTVYIYICISPSHSSKPRDNGSRSSFEYNGRRELEPSGFSFDIEYRISSNHLEKNHHLYLPIYHAFRTISSLPFFLKHSLIRSDSRCRYRVTSGSMVTSNPENLTSFLPARFQDRIDDCFEIESLWRFEKYPKVFVVVDSRPWKQLSMERLRNESL